MINKTNFIPLKYRQPNSYRNIFDNWNAVYEIGGETYYLEINADFHHNLDGKHINILVQHPKHRGWVTQENFKSIKSAVEYFEKFLTRRQINTY